MRHSICSVVTGLIMLFVASPLWGQELSDGSYHAPQVKAKAQVNEIKVFQILYADASELKSAIDVLFRQSTDERSRDLSQLRMGVDARTNSILVSGPSGDLVVIEDLLTRLDNPGNKQAEIPRRNYVVQLQNVVAQDVAHGVNQWLAECAKIEASPVEDPGNRLEKGNCIVVPEAVSNSLNVSTTFSEERAAELEEVIRALDTGPDMVKVQVVLKKTVDGIESVISRPSLVTIDQKKAILTTGSESESYTIEMTPFIIQGETPVHQKVTEIPTRSDDR